MFPMDDGKIHADVYVRVISVKNLKSVRKYHFANIIWGIFSHFFIEKIDETIHAEDVSGVIIWFPSESECWNAALIQLSCLAFNNSIRLRHNHKMNSVGEVVFPRTGRKSFSSLPEKAICWEQCRRNQIFSAQTRFSEANSQKLRSIFWKYFSEKMR